MSEIMNIRFGGDMPLTAVEVLTPDLELVQQYALSAGDERFVEVPSSDSFIRLRLPTGRRVNLRHSGDLQYLITPNVIRRNTATNLDRAHERGSSELHSHDLASFSPRLDASIPLSRLHQRKIAEVGVYNSMRSVEVLDNQTPLSRRSHAKDKVNFEKDNSLPGHFSVRWTPAVQGVMLDGGEEVSFEPDVQKQPYELNIQGKGRFSIRLPGSVESAFVRSDLIRDDQYLISVRVGTASSDADVVGGYIAQSDYFSAKTMLDWAKKEVQGLYLGRTNPYATAIALYLVLNLEPDNLMVDFPKTIVRRYQDIPDFYIIAAAYFTFVQRNRAQALSYVQQSLERGLPVHTEGLHWLSKILRMLGEEGKMYLDKLGRETQSVVWSSPFTALAYDLDEDERTIALDVGYALKL